MNVYPLAMPIEKESCLMLSHLAHMANPINITSYNGD